MKRNIILPKAVVKKYMTLGLCSTMAISNVPIVSVMANTSSTPTAPPTSGVVEIVSPTSGTTSATSTSATSTSTTSTTSTSTTSTTSTSTWSTPTTIAESVGEASGEETPESSSSGTFTYPTTDEDKLYTDNNGNKYTYKGDGYVYNHDGTYYAIYEKDAVEFSLAGTTGAYITTHKGHTTITLKSEYTGDEIIIPSSVVRLDEIVFDSSVTTEPAISKISFEDNSKLALQDGCFNNLNITELDFTKTSFTQAQIETAFSTKTNEDGTTSNTTTGSVDVMYLNEALYDDLETANTLVALRSATKTTSIVCISDDMLNGSLVVNANSYKDEDHKYESDADQKIFEAIMPIELPSSYEVEYSLVNTSGVAVASNETTSGSTFFLNDGNTVQVRATITSTTTPATTSGSEETSIIATSPAFKLNFEDILVPTLKLTGLEEGGSVEMTAKTEAGGGITSNVIQTGSDGSQHIDISYDTLSGYIYVYVTATTPTPGSGKKYETSWNTTELLQVKGIEKAELEDVVDVSGIPTGIEIDTNLILCINVDTFDNSTYKEIEVTFTEVEDDSSSGEELEPEPEPEEEEEEEEVPAVVNSFTMPIDGTTEDDNQQVVEASQFIAKVIGYKNNITDIKITDTIDINVLICEDDASYYELEEENSTETGVSSININVIYKDITIYDGKDYTTVETITAPRDTLISVSYDGLDKILYAKYIDDKVEKEIDINHKNDFSSDEEVNGGTVIDSFYVPSLADNVQITLYYNYIYSDDGVLYEVISNPFYYEGSSSTSPDYYTLEIQVLGFLKSYYNGSDYAVNSDEYTDAITRGYTVKDALVINVKLNANGSYTIVTSQSDTGNDVKQNVADLIRTQVIQVPTFVETLTTPNWTDIQINHGSSYKSDVSGDVNSMKYVDGAEYTSVTIANLSEPTRYEYNYNYLDGDEDNYISVTSSSIYGTIKLKPILATSSTNYYVYNGVRYKVTQVDDKITVVIDGIEGDASAPVDITLSNKITLYTNSDGEVLQQGESTSNPIEKEVTDYNNLVISRDDIEKIDSIRAMLGVSVLVTFLHDSFETVVITNDADEIITPNIDGTTTTNTSITITDDTKIFIELVDTRLLYTYHDVKYIVEDRGDGYKAYIFEFGEGITNIIILDNIGVTVDSNGNPVRDGVAGIMGRVPVETTFEINIDNDVPYIKTLSLPENSKVTLNHSYKFQLDITLTDGSDASGFLTTEGDYSIIEPKDSSAVFNLVYSLKDTTTTTPDDDDDDSSGGTTNPDTDDNDDSSGGTTNPDTDDNNNNSGGTTNPDTDGNDDSSSGGVTPQPDDNDDEDKDVYYTIRNQSSSRLDIDASSSLAGEEIVVYYDELADDEEITVTTASGSSVKTYTVKSGASIGFVMPEETVYVKLSTIETDADEYTLTIYFEDEDEGYIRVDNSYVGTDGKQIDIYEGEDVKIRAYPEDGYVFDSWSITGSARADVKEQLLEQQDEINDELDEDDDDLINIYEERTIEFIMPSGNITITPKFKVDEDAEEEEEETTSTTPTMPPTPSTTVPQLDTNYNNNYTADTSSPYAMILGRYIDVQSHWGKDAIGYMINRGLFNGTATNQFSPNLYMTRAMFITVLSRIDNVNTSIMPITPFIDVPSTSWYSGEISWAINNNIASAKNSTIFEPDSPITREDMALYLYNYMQEAGITLPITSSSMSFVDSADISAEASTAVRLMQQYGIIEGKGSGVFDPKGYSTRAEVCSMLMKFLEASGK